MSRKHKRVGAAHGAESIPTVAPSTLTNHSRTEKQNPEVNSIGAVSGSAPNQPHVLDAVRNRVGIVIANLLASFRKWREGRADSTLERKIAGGGKERSTFSLRSFLDGLNTVIGSIIGFLILGLIILTCIEARTPVTEIRTIVVPKSWEDRGDNPETVSQEVRRRSADAISVAGRASEFIGEMELHNFEIDLSGNQISSRSLVHLWRDKFYHNRRILEGGIVAQNDDDWTLWVTLGGRPGGLRTVRRTLNGKPNRDQILNEFTRLVLSATEQDVYASLLLTDGKYEEMDRYFWHEVMDYDLTAERRANFWMVRALSLVVRRRIEDSDEAFNEALRYSPGNSEINFVWAAMLKIEGREDEAIRKYEQVISADRKHARAYTNLGRIYFSRGNHDGGVQYFRKAVTADPKCFEAWNDLGASELQKESPNWQQGIEYYLQSLAANPDYAPALCNICGAYTMYKKPEEGLPFCQHASELRPRDIVILSVVRDNLLALGRKEEAEAVNNRIISIAKEEPTLPHRFNETIVVIKPESLQAHPPKSN